MSPRCRPQTFKLPLRLSHSPQHTFRPRALRCMHLDFAAVAAEKARGILAPPMDAPMASCAEAACVRACTLHIITHTHGTSADNSTCVSRPGFAAAHVPEHPISSDAVTAPAPGTNPPSFRFSSAATAGPFPNADMPVLLVSSCSPSGEEDVAEAVVLEVSLLPTPASSAPAANTAAPCIPDTLNKLARCASLSALSA